MTTAGSTWQKWDLHIHTPVSFEWKGEKFSKNSQSERDETCRKIINRMNEVDVAAFGIMDYWTFDGYLTLREYLNRHPSATEKIIFPGLEFRMEAPTDFRLNTHVLLDNSLSDDKLKAFLGRLEIGSSSNPPIRETFINLARSYDDGKLRLHGFNPETRDDDDAMHLLGMKTALIPRHSLSSAIGMIGKKNCFIIQPYDTSDGIEKLKWEQHCLVDSELMKMAHFFETRKAENVDLFLGFGHPTKKSIGTEFIDNLGGRPKPVLSGSDAHRISDYGVFPSNRVTWLKTQLSFAGLRQVYCEPARRCHIGNSPYKVDHLNNNKTKYCTLIKIHKIDECTLEDHWFENIELPLNPGLIAIIGNKGSGKSALADIIALSGNAHCKHMEFLNGKRFRKQSNTANQFSAELTWADGSTCVVNLGQDPDTEKPERIRYLPQQVLEELCNEISSGRETSFDREIKKVIFSHLPQSDRLNKANLDELLDYTNERAQLSISALQHTIQDTNKKIRSIKNEMSDATIKSYISALELKNLELVAHDASRPTEVLRPQSSSSDPQTQAAIRSLEIKQSELNSLNDMLKAYTNELSNIKAGLAGVSRIAGHADAFETMCDSFLNNHREEFQRFNLNIGQILIYKVDRQSIISLADQMLSRQRELETAISGEVGKPGLRKTIEELTASIRGFQTELDAPNKTYQDYIADHQRWQQLREGITGSTSQPGSIEYLKSRIVYAQTTLPLQLSELEEQRISCSREIHNELLKIRTAFENYYRPVQKIVAQNDFVRDSIQLRFEAYFAAPSFTTNFLDFIHKGRKGNFYGEDESRALLHSLLAQHDFATTDGTIGFIEAVLDKLTKYEQDNTTEEISIQSQLRSGRQSNELLDFLFGLQYLTPRYKLKLGEKDIEQLSPGEKGALLLVFYLLLDLEEIPIIIDQPEHNLDNESVVKLLVDCIRQATIRRQVIIVTHNPNLAVVCDAEQIICASIAKDDGNRVSYASGAIEDLDINKLTVNILEGTYEAFHNRHTKYHTPDGRNPRSIPVLKIVVK